MKARVQKLMQRYLQGEREGFSLVELIIVIAIMAILIAVVALAVIPYLNSARESKDRDALNNVQSAFKSAMANEEVAKAVNVMSGSGEIEVATSTSIGSGTSAKTLADYINKYMDKSLTDTANDLSSDACTGAAFKFYVKANAAGNKTQCVVKLVKGSAVCEDSDGKAFVAE